MSEPTRTLPGTGSTNATELLEDNLP